MRSISVRVSAPHCTHPKVQSCIEPLTIRRRSNRNAPADVRVCVKLNARMSAISTPGPISPYVRPRHAAHSPIAYTSAALVVR